MLGGFPLGPGRTPCGMPLGRDAGYGHLPRAPPADAAAGKRLVDFVRSRPRARERRNRTVVPRGEALLETSKENERVPSGGRGRARDASAGQRAGGDCVRATASQHPWATGRATLFFLSVSSWLACACAPCRGVGLPWRHRRYSARVRVLRPMRGARTAGRPTVDSCGPKPGTVSTRSVVSEVPRDWLWLARDFTCVSPCIFFLQRLSFVHDRSCQKYTARLRTYVYACGARIANKRLLFFWMHALSESLLVLAYTANILHLLRSTVPNVDVLYRLTIHG